MTGNKRGGVSDVLAWASSQSSLGRRLYVEPSTKPGRVLIRVPVFRAPRSHSEGGPTSRPRHRLVEVPADVAQRFSEGPR